MEILIPLGFFAMIAAIVILPGYLKAQTRQRMLDTMRVAYERGQPVPPELIDAINTDPVKATAMVRTPREQGYRDLRAGVITLCVAFALIIFGYLISFEESDAFFPMVGIAAFPGLIGLAQLAFGLIGINRARQVAA